MRIIHAYAGVSRQARAAIPAASLAGQSRALRPKQGATLTLVPCVVRLSMPAICSTMSVNTASVSMCP